MTYCFNDNEFTNWHLLEYLKRAYGAKISGLEFTIFDINNWLRAGKLPEAYGGHKLTVHYYKELDNLRVLTIERLSRSDIESVYGKLDEFKETLNKKRAVPKDKKRYRKQRTELYYKTLKSKKSHVSSHPDSVLPDNWKEAGITGNQIKRKSKSKQK